MNYENEAVSRKDIWHRFVNYFFFVGRLVVLGGQKENIFKRNKVLSWVVTLFVPVPDASGISQTTMTSRRPFMCLYGRQQSINRPHFCFPNPPAMNAEPNSPVKQVTS